MGFSRFSFLTLLILASTWCVAESTPETVQEMVERINRRYDDFFRFHRDMEARNQARLRGRDERKELERAHRAELERAREAYVKQRRPKGSDEALRRKWEEEQKARAEELEIYRKRYVEKRDRLEEYRRKGRAIPEMKEYDLEGYF